MVFERWVGVTENLSFCFLFFFRFLRKELSSRTHQIRKEVFSHHKIH
jgi:hypothetical protein